MLLDAVRYHVLGHDKSFSGMLNGSVGPGTQPGEVLPALCSEVGCSVLLVLLL